MRESYIEKAITKTADAYKSNRIPFLTALITGFAAHGYSFANKLVQQDDVCAMFGKGATLSSGRWGLTLMSYLFPDYSMPWIYGLLSILILAVSVCFIIDRIEIQNGLSKAVLAALFVSISSITGIFCLPFLSTSYATAILLAALFIHFLDKNRIVAVLLMVLSLGIYQAYVALAAGLCIVLLVKMLLCDDCSASDVLKRALLYFALLVASVAVYCLISLILNSIFSVEMNTYGISEYGILMRIRVAYTAFAGMFIKGYFSLVCSRTSLVCHTVVAAVCAVVFIKKIVACKDGGKIALGVVFIILLPLAIDCMYLASSPEVLGALGFMSFVSIYFLAFVLLDRDNPSLRGIVSILLFAVAVCNIYFSNKIYLKMDFQTKQMSAFCQGVMSRVISNEEYEPGMEIGICGYSDYMSDILDTIDTTNYVGLVSEDVFNIYTREDFIKMYLGYSGPYADFYRKLYLQESDEYISMECYPKAGCTAVIDGTMVVKLG